MLKLSNNQTKTLSILISKRDTLLNFKIPYVNMETKNDWVNNLKPGDPVFIGTTSFTRYTLTPTRVDRVGKIHIITKSIPYHKCKFNRVTLEEAGMNRAGSIWGVATDYLIEYSSENIARYELQKKRDLCNKIIKWLSEKDMNKQSPELIEVYYKILIQFKGDAS